MTPIKLACTVPLSAAVNAKRPTYGDCTVTLSTLDGLSPGALALLARGSDFWNQKKDGLLVHGDSRKDRLNITEETELAAIAALEALAAEVAAEIEKKRAEDERIAREKAEVNDILAIDPAYATEENIKRAEKMPLMYDVCDDERRRWIKVAKAIRVCDEMMAANALVLALDPASPEADAAQLVTDAYYGAKIEARDGKREWPAARAEVMARIDKWESDRAAARKARALARDAAILAYVRACAPEWKRAADDGRDVSEVGARHAAKKVKDTIQEALGLYVTGWSDVKPRDVPTTKAYEALDDLRCAVAEVLSRLPAELRVLCGEPEYDIVRLETEEANEEYDAPAVWTTAARAQIPVAGRTVQIATRAE